MATTDNKFRINSDMSTAFRQGFARMGRRALLLTLAVVRLGCSAAVGLPTIDYLNLNAESEFLLQAFATEGILLVPGVPGYAAARTAALESLTACVARGQGRVKALRRFLQDGSERLTIAAKTHGHALQPLFIGCPDFEQKADVLRTAIHVALTEVLRVWGQAGSQEVILRHDAGHPYASLAEAASNATHLEHFHVYSNKDDKDGSASTSRASLGLHTDAGLLLAFTSPLYSLSASVHSDHDASGLWIQRVNSYVEPVDLPTNAVAFVVGEAATWLPWASRPLPHELRLPRMSERAWYGVMTRLPEDAVKVSGFDPTLRHQLTFGQWWDKAADSLTSEDAFGCGQLHAADPTHLCPEGKAYCWMQCMTLPPACTASSAHCVHPDGTPWANHSEMCPTCTLTCPAFEGWDFCDEAAASDMIMQGFVSFSAGNKMRPCVILFFPSWVLNTWWKFWLGVGGVLLLGVTVEWVSTLHVSPDRKLGRLWQTLLYCTRMTLAYLVMLAAMTFCIEIFAAAIAGLGLGHACFSSQKQRFGGLSGPSLCCSHGELRRRHSQDIRVTPCLQADDCIVLRVGGMTCGSCAQTVTHALEGVAGVVSARVTLGPAAEPAIGTGLGTAEILVNAGFPGADAAVAAVELVGFDAQPVPKA